MSEIFARFYTLFEQALVLEPLQVCHRRLPFAVLGPFVMHFSFCAAQNVNVAT